MNHNNDARDLAIDIGRAISLQRAIEAFKVRFDSSDLPGMCVNVIYTGVSDEAARWLTELLNSPITRNEWLQSS